MRHLLHLLAAVATVKVDGHAGLPGDRFGMLIQYGFAFSDLILVNLVRGFYELDNRLFGTLLLTFPAAVLKLDKVKEFWLPASL